MTNYSAYGNTVTRTVITSPTPGGAIKFHPGTGIWYSPGPDSSGISGFRIDRPQQLAAFKNWHLNNTVNESWCKLWQVACWPRSIEGDTPGDFSAGFAFMDDLLDFAQQHNKYISLNIYTAHFGAAASSNYVIYPAYLVDGAQYGISTFHSPQVGGGMRLWQQATMDRYIAWVTAYGNRYNGHPNFEVWGGGETSLALDSGQDGYSVAALKTQLLRWIPLARQALPNTGIRIAANDMGADSNLVELFDVGDQYNCIIGGPDETPQDITQADRIYVGKKSNEWPNWDGSGDRYDESMNVDVYTDRRAVGKMLWMAENQWQSYDGRFTNQQLYDYAYGYTPYQPNGNGNFTMPGMQHSYRMVYANESNGPSDRPELRWSTGLRDFLRTHNTVARTTKPAGYP